MTSSNRNISALLTLCARGMHRSHVNSPYKGQWCRALVVSLICAWISGWVNTREVGGFRRHRAHYGVIVMNNHGMDYLSLSIYMYQSRTVDMLILSKYVSIIKMYAHICVCLLLCIFAHRSTTWLVSDTECGTIWPHQRIKLRCRNQGRNAYDKRELANKGLITSALYVLAL